MTDIDKTIKLVSDILKESEDYPWKTAKYLSQKLSEKDFPIRPDELEAALLDHAELKDRIIRYSFFPARKTLDLLWGHISWVNDFDNLPSPWLEPNPSFLKKVGEFESCEVPSDAVWCFLSHKFKDLKTVRNIRSDLLSRGYGVWMAEAEILQGEMITEKVQEGLKRSDRFVLYMTRKSLGSRWVLKEAGNAINDWNLPPIVLVDGKDFKLIDMFRMWLENKWNNSFGKIIDDLLFEATEERAATELHKLVIWALNNVPQDERVAVLYPESHRPMQLGFHSFEEVFPSR